MNVPNDALHGANSCTISLTKTENGAYKASSPSYPSLPAVEAASPQDATEQLKRSIEKHLWTGAKRG